MLVLIFAGSTFHATEAEDSAAGNKLGESEAPLATQGEIVLTQGEIDAAFARIPPENRLPFIREGAKVDLLIQNLLRNKVLANEAKKASYDQQPIIRQSLVLASENELAQLWLKNIVKQAPPVDYQEIAHEAYIANPEVWKSGETYDVSHILISSASRSNEAAEQIAAELVEELRIDSSRFDKMVIEYSDDPSKNSNRGRFPQVKKGDMVKPFEKAVIALTQTGEIVGPVQTDYGFHVIRLNGKNEGVIPEFNEIKALAMEQARNIYLEEYRAGYLRKALSQPYDIPDGAVEIMAKRYFGENLEMAPEFIQE
jgi:peptidyl-prolyl cis-trans isomerase C